MGGVVVDRTWDVERGDRLRTVRVRRRLRQRDVAASLRVSPVTVGRWEAGRPMRVDQLRHIARLFDVTEEWILDGPPVDVEALERRVVRVESMLRVVVEHQLRLERHLGMRVEPPLSPTGVRVLHPARA